MTLFRTPPDTITHNPAWLSLLRIGVALVLMVKIIAEFQHAYIIYSSQGIIQGVVNEKIFTPYTLTLYQLFELVSAWMAEDVFINIFFIVCFLLAIALLVGWQTRIVAIACWLFHVCLFNNSPLVSYGVDSFLLSLLFYCCIFPVHLTWSIDYWRHHYNYNANHLRQYQFFLQLHIAIVYLVAGVAKLQGVTWLNGEAVWYAISQPQFQSWFSSPFMNLAAKFPFIIYALTWSTLFVEIGYGFFIWFKRIRAFFFIAVVMMHFFIGIVMQLQLFAFVMIVFNVAAFGTLIYADITEMARKLRKRQPQTVVSPSIKVAS